MKKTTKLPARENFYSQLSETLIREDDYSFAKSVWKMFKCQNLLDYTRVYCQIDTLLLAEIFQKFRIDMLKFQRIWILPTT